MKNVGNEKTEMLEVRNVGSEKSSLLTNLLPVPTLRRRKRRRRRRRRNFTLKLAPGTNFEEGRRRKLLEV